VSASASAGALGWGMSGTQAGIQALLRAEAEAQKFVQAARERKAARLREARAEADREVALFRERREAEFRARLEVQAAEADRQAAELKVETEKKIEDVQRDSMLRAPAIADEIVQAVLTTSASRRGK